MPSHGTQLAELRGFCRQVEVLPYRAYRPDGWRARPGFLSPRPRSVTDTDNTEMRQRLAESADRSCYDGLIASELEMLMHGAAFDVPIRIAEEVQVAVFQDAYTQAASLSVRLRRGLTWWKTARYVRGLLQQYHGVTVASPSEKTCSAGLHAAGTYCCCAQWCCNCGLQPGLWPLEPDSLVYAGALTYAANYDAVAYFLR